MQTVATMSCPVHGKMSLRSARSPVARTPNFAILPTTPPRVLSCLQSDSYQPPCTRWGLDIAHDVIKFAVDVFNAIFGSDQQRQQAIDNISNEIGPLVDQLNANGNKPFKGRHMSGWIAKFSADTAFFSLTF